MLKRIKRVWDQIWETMAAHMRHSAHELGSIWFGPSTNAQPPELGMAWTKPPSMVSEGLKGKEASKGEAQPSVLAKFVRDSRAGSERKRDTPEMER